MTEAKNLSLCQKIPNGESRGVVIALWECICAIQSSIDNITRRPHRPSYLRMAWSW